MTNIKDNIKYIVDASVIIRRSPQDTYEFDSFPVHWNNFDKLINKGNIISTPIVKEEILFKYDDLEDWCDENNKMFKPPNKAIGKELSALDEKFPK